MDTDLGQNDLTESPLTESPLEVSPLKELQSSLKELKSIYASMEQRLKELEELAFNGDFKPLLSEIIISLIEGCNLNKLNLNHKAYFLSVILNN